MLFKCTIRPFHSKSYSNVHILNKFRLGQQAICGASTVSSFIVRALLITNATYLHTWPARNKLCLCNTKMKLFLALPSKLKRHNIKVQNKTNQNNSVEKRQKNIYLAMEKKYDRNKMKKKTVVRRSQSVRFHRIKLGFWWYARFWAKWKIIAA